MKCPAWNVHLGSCTLPKGHAPYRPKIGGKTYPAHGPHKDGNGEQFRATPKK